MTVSQAGKDFIKKFEGLSLTAYWDKKGYAIGYGNQTYEDGSKVQYGQKITKERAESLFNYKVSQFAKEVNSRIKKPVNQNQFDMCVSLAYNIGVTSFGSSTALRLINQDPNDTAIGEAFKLFRLSNGVVLKELVSRRAAEVQRYFSGVPTQGSNYLPYIAGGLLLLAILNNSKNQDNGKEE